jgi:hypothetical protein
MVCARVRDMAAAGVPVAVTYGVLGCSTRHSTSGGSAVFGSDWDDAKSINAVMDVHLADRAIGYWFITEEFHKSRQYCG